jgi:integrase
LIPVIDYAKAKQEIDNMMEGHLTPEEIEDFLKQNPDTLDKWANSSTYEGLKKILQSMGIGRLSEDQIVWITETASQHGMTINPNWVKDNPDADPVASFLQRKKVLPAKERQPLGPTLSDCLPKWIELKAKEKQLSSKHVERLTYVWDEFLSYKRKTKRPISALTKQDFLDYRNHLTENRGTNSPIWVNHRLASVTNILGYLVRATDWHFPPGISEWIQFHYLPYKAGKKNKAVFEVSRFSALLDKCEEWKTQTQEQFLTEWGKDKNLDEKQVKYAGCRHHQRLVRSGYMFAAVLRIKIQCGYDNIDVCRLKMSHLHIDGEKPYISLPRQKVAGMIGEAIPRNTPLLPSTVKHLKAWIDFEQPKGEYIFTSDRGTPMEDYPNNLIRAFNALASAAGVKNGQSLKHMRNVGPSLGKRAKLTRDERDAFLGHVVTRSTSDHYEDELPPEYLAEIVNLIGKEYFGGETW